MTKKTTQIQRASPVKKKPAVKKIKEQGIVLRIKETKLFGTGYENQVMEVCRKKNYPFVFKGGRVRGKRADFINRDKRLIIEVYHPLRSAEELQARMRGFLIQKFKTKHITKDRLDRDDWHEFLTTSIKAFLKQ